jgi:hypothetical protein
MSMPAKLIRRDGRAHRRMGLTNSFSMRFRRPIFSVLRAGCFLSVRITTHNSKPNNPATGFRSLFQNIKIDKKFACLLKNRWNPTIVVQSGHSNCPAARGVGCLPKRLPNLMAGVSQQRASDDRSRCAQKHQWKALGE